MTKIIPGGFCLFLHLYAAVAQGPAIQWLKNYGGSNNDVPYGVLQTTYSGYIATISF